MYSTAQGRHICLAYRYHSPQTLQHISFVSAVEQLLDLRGRQRPGAPTAWAGIASGFEREVACCRWSQSRRTQLPADALHGFLLAVLVLLTRFQQAA